MESGSQGYAQEDVHTLSHRTSIIARFQTLLEGDVRSMKMGNLPQHGMQD